jgi:hypothetical protein
VAGPCTPWSGPGHLRCYPLGSPVDDRYAVAANLASDLLYVLSGRQFAGDGACTSTARPAPLATSCRCWPWLVGAPAWDGSTWGWSCGCPSASTIRLPGYPVTRVKRVLIDGVELASSAYRLDALRLLVRTDGARWPTCQNLAAPLGVVGTWGVKYDHGADPPLAGREAAKALACEIYGALTGGECSLPTGVTRVVRQGVTYEKVMAAFDASRPVFGVFAVDAFLAAYNPSGQKTRTSVWSPDVDTARRG